MIRCLVVLTVMLAIGGCAVGGTASPAGTDQPAAPTSSTPEPGPGLAPRVVAPRDVRGIPACDLLTPAQQQALDIDPSTERPYMQGTALRCEWRTLDGEGVLTVTAAPEFPVGGLEGLYLVRSTYDLFEPGELNGYPTVRADRNDTGDRDCTLYVGVADDQLAWASVGVPFAPGTACVVARQMASDMLSNLPPLR